MRVEGVTGEFSRYIALARFEDLPEAVLHEAKRSFINWIACALGGCKSEPVEKALPIVRQLSGISEVAVIGRSERMDVAQACMINSMSAYALDFDDAHCGERIVLHPGGAVGPAALAMAERVGAGGKDMLHAFLLGIEVMCRVGNAVFESDNVGWYPTSNVAGIGAACAAAKLLGLDHERIAMTIGSAAALSAGMRASHGTMMKCISPARGASTGVTVALLSQAHVTGPRVALEAAGVGFADLMGNPARIASATELLGEYYEISNNAYKPYPCAVGLHPAITACIQLQKSGIAVEEISGIEIRVTKRVERVNAIKHPSSREQAKISLPHSAAVSLLCGKINESHYDKTALEDARVIRLRERVRLVVDDTLHKSQGRVIIHDQFGAQADSGVIYGVGTIPRPMSDADLMSKLAELASSTLKAGEIRSLAEACWDMENLTNLDGFASLLYKDVT